MMYKRLIRPLLFLLDAEKAHYVVFAALRMIGRVGFLKNRLRKRFTLERPGLRRKVMGLNFKNPVGLAAGFDKDAMLTDELGLLGFGFIEIGTVTPLPQPGNPKPRLFRLPADRALINRMGFNNNGAHAAALRLKNRKPGVIIGGNIGKNKSTSADKAADDYLKCFHELFDVVDYFVVNVSSPNTPGLRDLQEAKPLESILKVLQQANQSTGRQKPVLVKIAPDLTDEQIDGLLAIMKGSGVAGVVAANTTISREGLCTPPGKVGQAGAGGLSGSPLHGRAVRLVGYIKKKAPGLVIIASGGIFGADDAKRMLLAGADLVQVYTGFIYEGPALARRINESLAAG